MRLVLSVSAAAGATDGDAATGFVLRTETAAADALSGVDDERIAFGGAFFEGCSLEEATYRGLIWGLRNAQAHMAAHPDATGVNIRCDSEQVVRQLVGMYQVRDPRVAQLYHDAYDILDQIGHWLPDNVRRGANPFALELAELALTARIASGDYLVALDGTPAAQEPAPAPARVLAAYGPDVIAFEPPAPVPAPAPPAAAGVSASFAAAGAPSHQTTSPFAEKPRRTVPNAVSRTCFARSSVCLFHRGPKGAPHATCWEFEVGVATEGSLSRAGGFMPAQPRTAVTLAAVREAVDAFTSLVDQTYAAEDPLFAGDPVCAEDVASWMLVRLEELLEAIPAAVRRLEVCSSPESRVVLERIG